MARTVEAPHDLDRCPVCRNGIDPEALLCAACGAEKIMINDGKGDAASNLGCLGTLALLGGLAAFLVRIFRAPHPDPDITKQLLLAVSVAAAALGVMFLARGSRRGRENIENTTRPAWRHVSASDVVAAHKSAEEAAERAAKAADRAASEARKPAKRSFFDHLDTNPHRDDDDPWR